MVLALSWVNAASIFIFYFYPNLPYFILDLLCVFMPCFGYIDQIFQMIITKNSTNFKMHSSLVLIAANYLRVIYWFGKKFDAYLLWQSVFMLFIQFTLVFCYFRYLPSANDNYSLPEGLKDIMVIKKSPFRLTLLKAESFSRFMITLIIFCGAVLVAYFVSSLFVNPEWVADIIGMISNGIDCFVVFPPFVLVVFHRNISYVTHTLIIQWGLAVIFKLGLYIFRPVPWPFMLGLAVQAIFTFFTIFSYYQIRFFSKNKSSDESSEEEEENGETNGVKKLEKSFKNSELKEVDSTEPS